MDRMTREEHYQMNRMRRWKYILERGSRCELCGMHFDFQEAFDFHHPDPTRKESRLSANFWTGGPRGREVQREADQCHLLCAICHRLVHRSLRQGRNPLETKR